MRQLFLSVAACMASIALFGTDIEATKPSSGPLKILILTGSNNHDWEATTKSLQEIFAESEQFTVNLELNPERITAELLEKYDILLSNWNSYGKGKTPAWPQEAKDAYLEFVRQGGGHVVLHAGSSAHYDWADYQTIGLANWANGRTGHGKIHEFEVRASNPHHPIAEGISSFKTTDELWHKPFVAPNAKVIFEAYSNVTKNWEPSILTGRFGEGRCFTILLGHDAKSMRNPDFRKLLLRGTAWAGKADNLAPDLLDEQLNPTTQVDDHSGLLGQ